MISKNSTDTPRRTDVQTNENREPLGEAQNLDCDERQIRKRIFATAMARDVPIIPLDYARGVVSTC